jgi:tetratricopeptide (TPR) repeat protein
VTKLRGRTKLAVRDNVIFELGLFIGKLGRERVFIIIPQNNEKLHIPSDLLGINPGKYETSRTDNNLQSATASFCNQFRTAINFLGNFKENIQINTSDKSRGEDIFLSSLAENKLDLDWNTLFEDRKHNECIDTIKNLLLTEEDETNIETLTVGLLRCELKISLKNGTNIIDNYINRCTPLDYNCVANTYMYEGFFEHGDRVIAVALKNFPNNSALTITKSKILEARGSIQEAISCLQLLTEPSSEATLRLCDLLVGENKNIKALVELHKGFLRHPTAESVTNKFAAVARDTSEFHLSLYLYDFLVRLYSEYLVLMASIAIHLNLYDISIISYRKALELSKEREA